MALPDNVASTAAAVSALVGARAATDIGSRFDREDGGIALNDPSEGHLYQEWRAWIDTTNENVYLEADNLAPQVLYTGVGITEASITFDQNMRPALAFVEAGVGKLQWYDAQLGQQVVTSFPDIVNPRVILDDKRVRQSVANDIILGYVRNGGLYYRQQRDRFLVEYTLAASLPAGLDWLWKLAFGANYRLHFVMLSAPYVPPSP